MEFADEFRGEEAEECGTEARAFRETPFDVYFVGFCD